MEDRERAASRSSIERDHNRDCRFTDRSVKTFGDGGLEFMKHLALNRLSRGARWASAMWYADEFEKAELFEQYFDGLYAQDEDGVWTPSGRVPTRRSSSMSDA